MRNYRLENGENQILNWNGSFAEIAHFSRGSRQSIEISIRNFRATFFMSLASGHNKKYTNFIRVLCANKKSERRQSARWNFCGRTPATHFLGRENNFSSGKTRNALRTRYKTHILYSSSDKSPKISKYHELIYKNFHYNLSIDMNMNTGHKLQII